MNATNAPRPRRLAGYRPSALSTTGRPRKVADSRRVAGRTGTAPIEVGAAETRAAETPAAAGPADESTIARSGAPLALAADAARPAPAADADKASARPRAGRLTVVLLASAVVLGVLVGLVGWDLVRTDDRADARKAAQVVAADSMETILSYRYSSYDKGVAEAKTLMTTDFAKKYARTVGDVRSTVMETQSVVKADVVASSVISAEPDRVKALLFVNQTTTGEQVRQPRVDLNRVVVTLVRDGDGAWLVSDIDAL